MSRALHPLLAWTLILSFGVNTAYAAAAESAISTHLEPEIVDELETVRLVIRVSGGTPGQIDLAPLAVDFEVLGTQTFNQYRSINGAVESWVEYQIALRPNRTGTLTIPPLAFGKSMSEPLTLVVRAIDPALRSAIDRMVFFEVELTRNPVYIRGETVLIRRLYYSDATQLYSDLPGPPDIPGVRVLPLGLTQSDTVVRDGERYGVVEQRFALFPERVGTVTVPSISLTTSVQLEQDGRTRRTGARVSTPALTLQVRPIPPAWPSGVPWLPATAVTLDDTWTPDAGRTSVGDAVERHVTITVRGNVAAAIAPPADALPEGHFRQYPEPPVLADDRGGDTVTGIRSTTYAIVPTEPGESRLAGLEVSWWDVDHDALQVSRTPGRTVVINGVAPTHPPAPEAPPAAQTEPAPARSHTIDEPAPAITSALGGIVIGIAIALAASVALFPAGRTLLTRTRMRAGAGWRRLLVRVGLAGDQRGLAHAGRLRRLRRALADAFTCGQVADIERALAEYLACWYGLPATAAQAAFRAAGHGALLDRMQRARYGRTATAVPGQAEFMDALRALRRDAGTGRASRTCRVRSEALPELTAAR